MSSTQQPGIPAIPHPDAVFLAGSETGADLGKAIMARFGRGYLVAGVVCGSARFTSWSSWDVNRIGVPR